MAATATESGGVTQSLSDILKFGLGRWIDGEYARRYAVIDPTPATKAPGKGTSSGPVGQTNATAADGISVGGMVVSPVMLAALGALALVVVYLVARK